MPDFRSDATLVAMLRKVVAQVGTGLPDLPQTLHEHLLWALRKEIGERSHDTRFSAAGNRITQLANQFRARYAAVLASCLYSQLDRLQGREARWPTPEGDEVLLVPDAVIERRIAIDNLIRLVPPDVEDGPAAFDHLLCRALGVQSRGLRENPLRPAVFFHALGLCWQQVAGSASDELLILREYGPLIGPRVAGAYPMMCTALRDALGEQKKVLSLPRALAARATPAAEPAGATEGPRPSTAAAGATAPARPAAAVRVPVQRPAPSSPAASAARNVDPAAEPAGASTGTTAPRPAERHAPAAAASGPAEAHGTDHGAAFARPLLTLTARLFDPALQDAQIPAEARVQIARMQLPTVGLALADPTILVDDAHPVRRLIAAVCRPASWQGGPDALHARQLQLEVIAEMYAQPPADAARLAALCTLLTRQFLAMCAAPTVVAFPDGKATVR